MVSLPMKFQAATETFYYRENPYRDHLRDPTLTHSHVMGRCGSHHHRLVPNDLRTPTVMKRPQGPLLPRSATPRLVSRAPSRSNRKCWVTRNSNPLPIKTAPPHECSIPIASGDQV